MNKNIFRNEAALCRWTARIIGALLVFIVVSIAVGQGLPNPFTQPVRVQIGLLALALLLLGIVAGWRWELLGGITASVGWGLFVLAVIPSPRALNGFVLALALPGALYVASALLRRAHPKPALTGASK